MAKMARLMLFICFTTTIFFKKRYGCAKGYKEREKVS